LSPFLAGVTWLLVFQSLGEALVRLAGLPLPGPVAGMALLLGALLARGDVPEAFAAAADALARHLSLLFVPAGVGVMLYAHQLADEWVPIVVALVVSTVLAIAVAAVVFARLAGSRACNPASASGREGHDGGADQR
jgi:holin-like protein